MWSHESQAPQSFLVQPPHKDPHTFTLDGYEVSQEQKRQLSQVRGSPMVRIPTHREPTHPGEMLLEEFLNPMGITQRDLADAIHVPYQRVNEIVNGKRGVTPRTALRLAKFFRMSPDFWMNLQLRWDLFRAREAEAQELKRIRPVKAATPTGD